MMHLDGQGRIKLGILNFSVLWTSYKVKNSFVEYERTYIRFLIKHTLNPLTVDIVRTALEAFLHFLQVQSFQKLTALRKRQNELPMKVYEEEICKAVANSRVTIIAGDTGCGKS